MTDQQERTLVDVLSWNVYIFRMLLTMSRQKQSDSWTQIAEACIQQNIAMIQTLLPQQPLSRLTPVETEFIPKRRLTQIEELEQLFADSPNE